MVRDKEALLACAENTTKYINQMGVGSFIPFIIDIIDFLDKDAMEEEQKVQRLWEILYNTKNSNLDILGGGKSLQESYTRFVDDFLNISKSNRGYQIDNEDFRDISLDELYYVFSWIRRLTKVAETGGRAADVGVKNRSFKSTSSSKHSKRRNRRGSNKRNEVPSKRDAGRGLNTQLYEQLKDLNFD